MKIGPFDVCSGSEGYIIVDEAEYSLTIDEMFQLGAVITQQAENMRARLDEEAEGEGS